MNNFAITHIYYSDAPNLIRLIIFTNNPCHLFAYKTGKEPILMTHWTLIRRLAFKCIPEWRILRAIVREQNEAGDTTLHTIDLPGWDEGQNYWMVVIGTVGGSNSPSMGPLLKHVNPGGAEYKHARFPSSDGDKVNAFYARPPGLPHYDKINEDPPDENASYLRSTQTLGPFPQPPAGELYHLEPVPSPQKYYLIKQIEWRFRVKAHNWSGIWTCHLRWPCYSSELKLNTGQSHWEAPHLVLGWGEWRNAMDYLEKNPFTNDWWFYPDLENIQVGMQMRQPCRHAFRASTYCTQLYFNIIYWGQAPEVYP